MLLTVPDARPAAAGPTWQQRLIRSRVAWHLLALGVISTYVFSIHRDALFFHLDGSHALQLIEAQHRWLPLSASLGLDPYRGPGNLFFPFNFRLLPVYAIQTALFDGHVGRVITFVLYNCQNFLLLCLLAGRLRLPSTVGILAGWGMALTSTPLIWTDQTTLLFPLYALAPHLFELTTFAVVLFVSFSDLGRVRPVWSWVRIAVCVFVVLWMAASSPLMVVCLAPFVVVLTSTAVMLANGRERVWKLGALGLAGSALWVTGAVAYVTGVLRAGPAAVFGSEIATYQSGLWWSSLIYQYDRFPAGTLLVIVSLLTAVVVAARAIRTRDRSPLVCASITHGVLTCGMMLGWPILERLPVLHDQLRHMRLFYFELPLLPFYMLFSALAVAWTARWASMRTSPASGVVRHEDAWIVGVIALVVLPATHDLRQNNPYRLPIEPTTITRYLQAHIGLNPGDVFRGRAVTLYPPASDRAVASWDSMIASDIATYDKTGNDRRFVGLWAFGIPTLQEYSQVVAPSTYFWLTRAMSSADDTQDMRNHALITRLNVPLLELLGVRFVITPARLTEATRLQLVLQDGDDYLYAVPGANLGQHSPTTVIRIRDAPDLLQRIRGTADLLDRTFVLEEVPPVLAPAAVTISMERSAISVTGTSQGTALVVLPFTYSRCYGLSSLAQSKGVRLLRVNLGMLGLLFTREVDATLTMSTGLFNHSNCLLSDLRDHEQLALGEAARLIPRGGLLSDR